MKISLPQFAAAFVTEAHSLSQAETDAAVANARFMENERQAYLDKHCDQVRTQYLKGDINTQDVQDMVNHQRCLAISSSPVQLFTDVEGSI